LSAAELLTSNLPLIERAIAFACRRNQLSPEDAEEFASVVKLRLVENDYAILRAHEGRSSLMTFIGIVVQRMLLDFRIHTWGKWHASAEAKRLGPAAMELEQLLHRDNRTFDDACRIMSAKFEGLTREAMQSLAEKLPARAPRRRDVPLEDAIPVAVTPGDGVEENVLAGERQDVARRVTSLMNASIERLPDDDRVILQLRFQDGMSVAQIARAFRLDQKLLYRRIDRHMRAIRKEIESAGLSSAEVLDLIGRDDAPLEFNLRNQTRRPSIGRDETVASYPEDSP
jgi:RNA polymerase sigma factor for flagellar operon FliA